LHTNCNNDSNTDFEAALHFEPTSRSVPKQFGSPITSIQNTIDLLYERIKFSLKKKKSGLYAIEMTYNLSNTHKTNKQTKIRKRQFMAKYCVHPIAQGALFDYKNARKLKQEQTLLFSFFVCSMREKILVHRKNSKRASDVERHLRGFFQESS